MVCFLVSRIAVGDGERATASSNRLHVVVVSEVVNVNTTAPRRWREATIATLLAVVGNINVGSPEEGSFRDAHSVCVMFSNWGRDEPSFRSDLPDLFVCLRSF